VATQRMGLPAISAAASTIPAWKPPSVGLWPVRPWVEWHDRGPFGASRRLRPVWGGSRCGRPSWWRVHWTRRRGKPVGSLEPPPRPAWWRA